MSFADRPHPRTLYLCRHGQSEANAANVEAIASGAEELGPVDKDPLVRLTPLGIAQAGALGTYLAAQEHPPRAIVSSPFERCVSTARIAAETLGLDSACVFADDRLHERNLGILDRLTPRGIRERYPEEAARRSAVGKYAYRPPKGESWMDVADRIRPACDELFARFSGKDLAVVTHQAVILCMRYVLEDMTIAELTAIDGAAEVYNCGVTTYAEEDGTLRLRSYNVDPMSMERGRA